jgi:hypothetical protein
MSFMARKGPAVGEGADLTHGGAAGEARDTIAVEVMRDHPLPAWDSISTSSRHSTAQLSLDSNGERNPIRRFFCSAVGGTINCRIASKMTRN